VPTADVTKLIEEAIRGRRVLRVTYHALDGTELASLIEPLAIRFNRARHRVLWCWSRTDGHLEELLWDGIEDAAATGEVFAPRPWTEET
jgi:predicted DNA-binding transcriptional regulator YafY